LSCSMSVFSEPGLRTLSILVTNGGRDEEKFHLSPLGLASRHSRRRMPMKLSNCSKLATIYGPSSPTFRCWAQWMDQASLGGTRSLAAGRDHRNVRPSPVSEGFAKNQPILSKALSGGRYSRSSPCVDLSTLSQLFRKRSIATNHGFRDRNQRPANRCRRKDEAPVFAGAS
jgi:hypothetical protein